MSFIDWGIVAAYCLLVTFIGMAFKKKAEGGIESFFLSGRKLTWWLAGTSLIATSFASDTPLFVTGLVRRHGISGNWHWWFVALGSVASLYFFSRLWRRARIVTDMEFIELRYGPGPGAVLRAAKAVFLGIFFNIYVLGAWPVLGLTKVLEETTDWSKAFAVFFCGGLALLYAAFSGLWGVVATDFLQFIWAMLGAIVLAVYAIYAVGGLEAFADKVGNLPQSTFLPAHTPDAFWSSPWIFFLSLVLVQWWARGVEGDGVAVQRLSACKDEKHSFFAMLWFNIGHYALRPWPWIIVALSSLIMLPLVNDAAGIADPERAYPRMIMLLLPVGLKGVVLASFFAAFMSTVDTHLNWGASYVVNDIYRRFINKNAPTRHYVTVARIVTVLLMIGGACIALVSSSIVDAFYNVLLLFSGIGLVGVARWFWWRVNAYSEMSAMIASGLLTLMVSPIAKGLGLADVRTIHMFIVVIGSTVVWLLVTFVTKPAPEKNLIEFYKRVNPYSLGWGNIAKKIGKVKSLDSFWENLLGWAMGVMLILGMTISIGKVVLGQWPDAFMAAAVAGVGLIGSVWVIRRMRWS